MTDTTPWWQSTEPHRQVAAAIEALDNEQSLRRDLNYRNLRFYSNRMAQGLSGSDWAVFDADGALKMNVVKAVINTVVAWVATNRTRTMFLTDKGSYTDKKNGKLMGKFIVGERLRRGVNGDLLHILRDAGIFGDGLYKIFPKYRYDRKGNPIDGEICCERVLSEDIIVDETECRHGKPRMMIQHAEVDPHALAADYPQHEDAIHSSGLVREGTYDSDGAQTSTISVMESWRLPDGPDAPGRHVVCTDQVTLIDEEWEKTRYPFAHFGWDPAVLGFWSIGIAEELAPIQREINYILQKVQRLMTLATSQIWVEKGSEVNLAGLNNEDFMAREYKGRPPVFMTVAAVSPEYFNQLDRLWARAFETIGVNQMSATGEKPAGLNAGVAIRNYRDVTSRRFLHVQQRWEDFNVHEVDERLVEAASEIADVCETYKVKVADQRGLETLDWSEINLERDRYIMQAHPVNFMPDEPAGKMQTIKEFGEISPAIQQSLVGLMDYPDLEGAVGKAMAPQRLCELLIERMVEHGEYREPDPFVPPDVVIPMMRTAIIEAEIDNTPEDRIDLLRNYVVETQKLWEQQPAPMAPAGPAAPPTPGAPGQQPMPPPAPPMAPPPAI